jgi:hypothetical protein
VLDLKRHSSSSRNTEIWKLFWSISRISEDPDCDFTLFELAPRSAPPEEEGSSKKKGGIQIPEHWPWEEAKKIFEQPDVIPAHEVEVILPLRYWLDLDNFDDSRW